jgi:hypothetical protein
VEDGPYVVGVTPAPKIRLTAFLQLFLAIRPDGVEQAVAERPLLGPWRPPMTCRILQKNQADRTQLDKAPEQNVTTNHIYSLADQTREWEDERQSPNPLEP